MVQESRLATALLVRLGEMTNRTFVLPLVVFFPTSRCNSRCVSCDWWKCSGAGDLTLDEIAGVAHALPALGTRVVLFSGGEPLLRPEVFEAAQMFRAQGMTLHLLTSGVLLERCALDVAREFSRVIVSLDATTEALYHTIRGVSALTMVEKGVARLRRIAADVPVTARATIHRLNFRELPHLIGHAKAMALDGISFLAADMSSSAFGRERPPQPRTLALDAREVAELQDVVEQTIENCREDFESVRTSNRDSSRNRQTSCGGLRSTTLRLPVRPPFLPCPATRRTCRWWWRPTGPCARASSTSPWGISASRRSPRLSRAICRPFGARSTSARTPCARGACAR